MSFITWDNQADSDVSLISINSAYGLPDESNGYKMDEWDFSTSSDDGLMWGFFKPEARLAKEESELISIMIAGYVEHDDRPEGWFPEE